MKQNLRTQLAELLNILFPDYTFAPESITWNRAGHRQDNAAWQAIGRHKSKTYEVTYSSNGISNTIQEPVRFRIYSFSSIGDSIKILKHNVANNKNCIIAQDPWSAEI